MDSSEAVRDCFTMGPPAARMVSTMNPHPPYAVDRPRPQSAPLHKKLPGSKPVWHDSRADIIPKQSRKFILSLRHSSSDQPNRYAPYAGE